MADAVTGGEIIATVRKNSSEELRIARTEFNGIDLLDVRVWTVPAVPGQEGNPTRKGLTLRPETWAELLPYIAQAVGADGSAAEPEPVATDSPEAMTGDPFGEE